MGDGKPARAPCGHDGEHVVGQYVKCAKGCDDAVPMHVDPEDTLPYFACVHDATYTAVMPGWGYKGRWCFGCGKYLGLA